MPRADQRWGTPPEALNHVPNPCLGKSDGECPTHQQWLSVLSVWLYAWSVPTYRKLEGAEASVDASSKFRRRCACRNQRRLFQLLHDEPNGQCASGLPLAGTAWDRQQCFDCFITPICQPVAVFLRTRSRRQKAVSVSSWESELYAVVSTGVEALGLQSALRDLGNNTRVTIACDNQGVVDHTAPSGTWVGETRAHETSWAASGER